MITLIAALDRRHAIGRAGAMPWHLPDDLRRFKRLTLGKPVLMGRKTALAIGRALSGRENLILSRHGDAPYPGQIAVASLEAAVQHAGDAELMVIGGGEVYAQTLARAQRLHLTWIDTETPDADTWFPPIDPAQWRVTHDEAHPIDAEHAHAFRFVDYERVAQPVA